MNPGMEIETAAENVILGVPPTCKLDIQTEPSSPMSFHAEGMVYREGHTPIRLVVAVEGSDDGGFCIRIPQLPGVVSEGDTLDEALQNITEAFRGAAASYRAAGEPIPWVQDEHSFSSMVQEGEFLRGFTLNV